MRMIRTCAVVTLLAVMSLRAEAQSCPPGRIQNFQNNGVSCGATSCQVTYRWDSIASDASYQILAAQIPTFCDSLPTSYSIVGLTSRNTTLTVILPRNQVQVAYVR